MNYLTYRYPEIYLFGGWFTTDYRKEIAFDGEVSYRKFNNNTLNAFNIDMVYRWCFAPKSDIIVVWKMLFRDIEMRHHPLVKLISEGLIN